VSDRLAAYLKKQRARVDAALDRFLLKAGVRPPRIHEAMRYSVFAGGKRLRPILCLAGAELCGGSWRRVLPTACALEMIHTYSLIHDDLPAMDDDDFRRGRPTCHKKFGEGVAILAGDALLTQGFQVMAQNARMPGVKPGAVVRAMTIVADAAGSTGMIGGQTVDLEMAGKNGRSAGSRRETLDYIHSRKTGALIRASLRAGGVLAGGSPPQLSALDRYGESIGLAFQIADDILDIVGDKKLLGKRGSDRDNDKLTFPAVYGMDKSRSLAEEQIRRAKTAAAVFGPRGSVLCDLADYIINRKN
jgi:geranylgeranyl diphosphate synthase, type II